MQIPLSLSGWGFIFCWRAALWTAAGGENAVKDLPPTSDLNFEVGGRFLYQKNILESRKSAWALNADTAASDTDTNGNDDLRL